MAATIAIASIPLSASAHSNDKNYSIAVTSSNSGHHNGQFQTVTRHGRRKIIAPVPTSRLTVGLVLSLQ